MAIERLPDNPETHWAFRRYEQVRHRMPSAASPRTSVSADNLNQIAGHFDAFVLDAFGVLNLGNTAIPGAPEALSALRRRNKRLCVLTNGATQTQNQALLKYQRLGFDFSPAEVVSSRDIAATSLSTIGPGICWAAAAGESDDFSDIHANVIDLIETPGAFTTAEGFLFLSSTRWTDSLQQQLLDALRRKPRPLVVANPDLVAPHGGHLSIEPGSYAHAIADELAIAPVFFGKPYGDAFDAVKARWPDIPDERIAMVGDTLHTDILGAQAAGIKSVLVTGHGIYAGQDWQAYIDQSGITPDFVVTTT